MKKLVIGAVAVAVIAAGIHVYGDTEKIEYRYEVQAGDTVWGVAEKVATKNEDVRRLSYDILKENQVTDGIIVPGQVLIIHVRPIEKPIIGSSSL